MTINNIKTEAKQFAFDGCHKIYILETEKDLKEAMGMKYNILPIEKLKTTYTNSCGLRFINSWDLETSFVKQSQSAKFTNN